MDYFKTIISVYECGSTMDLAKSLSDVFKPPYVIRSYTQTKGRGQYGRSWDSMLGGLFFTEALLLENILGFSTFLSIPIMRAIKKYVKDVKVKWPNDIVVGRKKLGGILVERSNLTYAGVGINVCNDISSISNIAVRICDFANIDQTTLFYEILEEETQLLGEFVRNGFQNFVEEYNRNLVFINEEIQIESDRIYKGVVLGAGKNGELLLETHNGVAEIYSGTVLNFYEETLKI